MNMDKKQCEALAKRLLAIRHTRKWTQERMARAIGIHRSRLSHAEQGIFSKERSQSVFLIRKFLESAS
jgi:transcriptional regulator with XRE-family HTH domain